MTDYLRMKESFLSQYNSLIDAANKLEIDPAKLEEAKEEWLKEQRKNPDFVAAEAFGRELERMEKIREEKMKDQFDKNTLQKSFSIKEFMRILQNMLAEGIPDDTRILVLLQDTGDLFHDAVTTIRVSEHLGLEYVEISTM